MCNAVNPRKLRSQTFTGSNENARTEPRGRLTKVIGGEHCGYASLVVAAWNAPSCYSTPSVRETLGTTTGTGVRLLSLVRFPPSRLGNAFHHAHRPAPRGPTVSRVLHCLVDSVEVRMFAKHESLIGMRRVRAHPIPQFTLGDCIVSILEHFALVCGVESLEVRHLGIVYIRLTIINPFSIPAPGTGSCAGDSRSPLPRHPVPPHPCSSPRPHPCTHWGHTGEAGDEAQTWK